LGAGVKAERADAWRNQLIRTLNGGGDYEALRFCFAVQRLARQSIWITQSEWGPRAVVRTSFDYWGCDATI